MSSSAKKKETGDTPDTEVDVGEMMKLSKDTFISVKYLKKTLLIDIRKYYVDMDTMKLKPTTKGISLTLDQWNGLKEMIETIDGEIADKQCSGPQ